MITEKLINRFDVEGRQPSRHCKDCGAATRERKDFCPEHVEQNPYVADLLRVMDKMDQEDARVSVHGHMAVDAQGENAKEILAFISVNSAPSVERIAKELSRRDVRITTHYLVALEQGRLITVERNKRGKLIAKIR